MPLQEETTPPFTEKPNTTSQVTTTTETTSGKPRLFNVSLRGVIVTLVVITVCVMAFAGRKVEEPLYTLVGLTVGYYFGQNQKKVLT